MKWAFLEKYSQQTPFAVLCPEIGGCLHAGDDGPVDLFGVVGSEYPLFSWKCFG